MDDHDSRSAGSSGTRTIGTVVAIAVVLAGLGASLYWFWSAAHDVAESRLQAKAKEAGVELTYGSLELHPSGAVTLRNVVARHPASVVALDEVRTELRLFSRETLDGRPPIEGIVIGNGRMTILAVDDDDVDRSAAATISAPHFASAIVGAAAHPPHVSVGELRIDVSAQGLGAEAIIVRRAKTRPTADAWHLQADVVIEASPTARWRADGTTRVATSMSRVDGEWRLDPTHVRFSEPARVNLSDDVTVTFAAAEVDVTSHVAISDVEVHLSGPASLLAPRPITIEQISAGPFDALQSANLDGVENVRVSGLELETSVAALRTLRGDATSDSTDEGESWNARLDRRLRALFDAGDQLVDEAALYAPRVIVVDDAKIEFADAGLRLEPLTASWTFDDASDTGRFEARTNAYHDESAEQRVRIGYEATPDDSRFTVAADGLDLSLGTLVFDDWPVTGRGDFELTVAHDASHRYPVAATFVARDATVEIPQVSVEPLRLRDTAYRFDGTYDPRGDVSEDVELLRHPTGGVSIPKSERFGTFEIDHGLLRVADVEAELRLGVYGLDALPARWPARVDVTLDLAPTPINRLFEAAPPELLGAIAGSNFAGELGAWIRVEAPLRNASRTRWEVDRDLVNFGIVEMPHQVDVRRLLGSMDVTIVDVEAGYEQQVRIPPMRSDRDPRGRTVRDVSTTWKRGTGCGSYVYVPLDQISGHLPRGVLTTEDAAFFRHAGFNEQAIKRSLEKNLEERRFARGASTIPMQLAKNLFLGRDKTTARKLREAFLVWLMESVVDVPKERMLEVYLNVIEYGPGIYGVWHASLYYFGTEPRDLTVGQVAWLVSVIPNPTYRHRYFERGEISDFWWDRMKRYIDAMYRKGHIDEYERFTAKVERPRFREANTKCEPR